MKNPKVSIIIPFYNCDYIDQAIHNALEQTYPTTEVIVVDDGSTKNVEKLQSFRGQIRILQKANGGTGSALNEGFRNATGEYIAWLSSDDILAPTKVARQVQWMKEQRADISYTNYTLMNSVGNVTHAEAGIGYDTMAGLLQHFQVGCPINGSTVMMRREVYETIGEFREDHLYTQDFDYWLRVVQRYHFTYLPEVLTYYRVHEQMGSQQKKAEQEGEIQTLLQVYADPLLQLIERVTRRRSFTFPVLTLCQGGAQRMLVEITNGLVEKGHQVYLLMPSGGVVEFDDVKGTILRTSKTVLRAEDFPTTDIIVSNFYLTVPVATEASRAGKGKHIRFSLCYEPMFLQDQHQSFPTYHATPYVIVLSKFQQQLVSINHGIHSHIVPVGVSDRFFDQGVRFHTGDKLHVSTILRYQQDQYAWHREQKYVLETFDHLSKTHPNVQFSIICPPQELANSRELQAIRQQYHFTFYTPVDDKELAYYYSQSDIFVATSIHESAALPGLEAMKCGATLVALHSGGNLEYCRDEENCLLSYRYENRLYTDIERLLQNAELRNKLAHQGKEEATQWTWKRSIDKFEEAIWRMI